MSKKKYKIIKATFLSLLIGFIFGLIGIFTLTIIFMGLNYFGFISAISEGYGLYSALKFSTLVAVLIGIICMVFGFFYAIMEILLEEVFE